MISNLDLKKLRRMLQQASSSVSAIANAIIDWSNISNKPTEFPPEAHNHDGIYLNKENTEAFTPDADYEPATKKYVDDNSSSLNLNSLTEKPVPANNDILLIEDSADAYAKKKVKISSLPSGGGGGSVNTFSTYQDLLDDATVEDGNFGVVTNMMNAIFIKFTDWYAIGRKLIWKVTANTKWYLPMEDSVNDASGNSFNATATNVTYVTGKVGAKAGSFNGSTSKALYLGNIVGGATITNITMMCWINLSSTSIKGCAIDIGSNPDASGYNLRGFGIGVGGTSMDNNGNNLIGIYDGSRWLATNRAIGTGWHHIAMTINGTSKPTLYLDGVQVYTDSGSSPLALSTTTPNAVVGGTYNNRFFPGYIDEVIVETSLWTSQEIFEYFMQTQ